MEKIVNDGMNPIRMRHGEDFRFTYLFFPIKWEINEVLPVVLDDRVKADLRASSSAGE